MFLRRLFCSHTWEKSNSCEKTVFYGDDYTIPHTSCRIRKTWYICPKCLKQKCIIEDL